VKDDARLASEADRLLNEPLLVQAFEAIESDSLEDALRYDPSGDGDEMRFRALTRINIIRELRGTLGSYITRGAQAAKVKPYA